jgi:hypothetical protein
MCLAMTGAILAQLIFGRLHDGALAWIESRETT